MTIDTNFSDFDKNPDSKDDYSRRSITLRSVTRLYGDCSFIGVKEFWIYGQGWISNEYEGDITEQIRNALEVGATKIQLHLRHPRTNHDVFPDYHARELTE